MTSYKKKSLHGFGFIVLAICFCFASLLAGQTALTLTSPNGGETWRVGSSQTITWTNDSFEGDVSISYSIDGGGTWVLISEAVTNTGTYAWTVPNAVSDNCLIKVTGSADGGECETRGTWLWASSIQTEEKRAQTFKTLEAARINTVMLSTPPANGNFGYGNHENFLAFISEAKDRNISVHAWIINSGRLSWADDTYVDYRKPEEQEAQAQWALAIMEEYGHLVDGLHMDYIRYLDFEEVNNEGKMDGVRATVRAIHDALEEHYPDKLLTAAVFSTKGNRFDHKDDGHIWNNQVPEWFRNYAADNPDQYYTSNNYYHYGPHHMQVQQDPVGWLNEGIIDAVMPMMYALEDEPWQRDIGLWNSLNEYVGNDITTVCAGLAWKNDKWDAPGLVRKIKYSRSQGHNGNFVFILCNHETDDQPLIDALTVDGEDNEFDAPYKEYLPSCLSCADCSVITDTSDTPFAIEPATGPTPTKFDISDFSLFATNSIYLKTRSQILSGNVGVSGVSKGSKLGSDSELVLANSINAKDGVTLVANRVKIKSGSTVDNVYYNTLKNYGTIRGTSKQKISMPMKISLPAFPGASAGSQNITVAARDTHYLAPGAYGNIKLEKSATLIFTGGTYNINDLQTDSYPNIYFQGPATVKIKNRLYTGKNPEIGPEEGSGVNARNIVFYVAGKNGSSGSLSASPKSVVIGIRMKLKANIYAPNGTIHLKARGACEGAYVAKDVLVEFYTTIKKNSRF